MSTPFTPTTKVVINPLAAGFVFSDTFDFTAYTIDYYHILITPPSGILYTIDGSSLEANNTSIRTLTVLPTSLGFTGTTLGDGVYKIQVRVHQTGDGVGVYASLELDTIIDYAIKQILDPTIAKLAQSNDCGCSLTDQDEVNEVFSMWLQLQGAYLLVSYGSLVSAQQIINTLTNYTTSCNCSC